MSMIALVYVSFASKPVSDDELKAILATSRKNNQSQDVTGMLLYRDGFFIQALEGESDVVHPLYEKIKTDPRHRSILKVYEEPVRQRSFGDWSMGFNKLEDQDLNQVDGFTDYLNQPDSSFSTSNPNRARLLLESFKNRTFF